MTLSNNSSNGGIPLLGHKIYATCIYVFLGILLLTGCLQEERPQEQQAQAVRQASHQYKSQKTYQSLEQVVTHLHKGMNRAAVEQLLGKADYSPIKGQEYYSSDRREHTGSGKEQITLQVGLVVDYRDEQEGVTGQLQSFWLGPIGE